MNKNTLIDRVAARTGLAKGGAAEAVEAMLNIIAEALENGDTVKLVGFGSFRVTERKASEGRNPRTGALIHIDPVRNIKFRQGVDLKNRVNVRNTGAGRSSASSASRGGNGEHPYAVSQSQQSSDRRATA